MAARLYSAPQVANLLGVELDTLYRYARRGEIRGLKIGKLWRFTEADVDDFVNNRRVGTSPTNGNGGRHAEQDVELLVDLLAHAAKVGGPAKGLIGSHGLVSYEQVDRLSDRLAAALRERGIQSGDRVLLILPNCIEFVISMFAVWKIGAILVPESPAIRPASLLHVIEDAKPAGMILDRPLAEQLGESGAPLADARVILIKDRTFTLSGLESTEVVSLDVLLDDETPHAPLAIHRGSATDVVSITYTSGSTGLPKGVMHTHESWLASAAFTRKFPQVTREDHIVIPLPLYHGLAFRQILAYAWAGGTVAIATDIYQALKWLREYRPTALLFVPAACGIAIDHFAPVLEKANEHVRYVEIGSAALPPERLNRLASLMPSARVHLPYGLTEARVAFLERGEDGLLNRIAALADGLDLRVESNDGEPAAAGETGEIVLSGRGLMKGYWGSTSAEQAAVAKDGFRTGDVGRINTRGEVELLGRLDDVLKVGGKKVSPQEGEMVLNRHPDVAESAVVARPDSKGIFENELIAYVVLKNGANGISEKELIAHCRAHLEPHKVPAAIHFRRSLPKSSVGKVLRHAIA